MLGIPTGSPVTRRELEDLIELLESTGTTVRTCQTGEYDLGTPSGRMAARIVGAVARHESEHKSARLRRKHLELAEQGAVSGGGDRPFGYEADRVTVRDEEAAVVRSMAADVLAWRVAAHCLPPAELGRGKDHRWAARGTRAQSAVS